MDADVPLKTLFRLQGPGLLRLIGERGATLLSARVVELPASRRSVDMVLRLRRGRDAYLRHVEFEQHYRPGLELRLFEYAARLRVQLRLPVATTVCLLRPPAPRQIGYLESAGGRVVCVRRFDSLRVWELDPEELVRSGPGPATLVGRTRTALPHHVGKAARVIMQSTAGPERNDLLFILQALCGERYTPKQLGRLIPREAVMASVMFAKEFRQARAEERVRATRRALLDIVRNVHPGALAAIAPAAEACDSLPMLRRWTVAAARLRSRDLVRLVSGPTPPSARGVVRSGRAPRPLRRSRARRGRSGA